MNPTQYQKQAMRTECPLDLASLRILGIEDPNPDFRSPNDCKELVPVRLLHAGMGIAKEQGEFFKFLTKWLFYGKKYSNEEIRHTVLDELGDILWFVAEACEAAGITLEQVMAANNRKLRARYPERYSDEQEAEENRDRGAEAEAMVFDNRGFGESITEQQVMEWSKQRRENPDCRVCGNPNCATPNACNY